MRARNIEIIIFKPYRRDVARVTRSLRTRQTRSCVRISEPSGIVDDNIVSNNTRIKRVLFVFFFCRVVSSSRNPVTRENNCARRRFVVLIQSRSDELLIDDAVA